MIDHMGIGVSDYAASKLFYLKVLKPLGYGLVHEIQQEEDAFVGFGPPGKPAFWIAQGPVTPKQHIAFIAPHRAAVDSFYQTALEAGATDNGAPGVRTIYHPHYYGAFVLDPDGYNIEAVCHTPESDSRSF